MYRISLEVACPKHGFERFSVKVVKRYNIPSKDKLPYFRKLRPIEISQLCIGRNVTEEKIEKFVNNYLSRIGMKKMIINMKLMKIV